MPASFASFHAIALSASALPTSRSPELASVRETLAISADDSANVRP